MKLKATENNVIVKLIKGDEGEVRKNGIIIQTATSTRERSQQSEILDIGMGYNEITGKWFVRDNIKIGDIVLTAKHAGQDFSEDDFDKKAAVYTIIEYDDIYAIVEK